MSDTVATYSPWRRLLYKAGSLGAYYLRASTLYQVHSPIAVSVCEALYDDDRRYYAFESIERRRDALILQGGSLWMTDYGTGRSGLRSMRQLALRSSSSPAKGRLLFRLAARFKPDRVLELGACIGIGALYLAYARPHSRLLVLEGSEQSAAVGKGLFAAEGLRADWRIGPFDQTLEGALRELGSLDLAHLDGHHEGEATWRYYQMCADRASPRALFVIDDLRYSPDMQACWQRICADPRARLTIDLFDMGLVFFDPALRQKQRLTLISYWKKPWAVGLWPQ